MPKMALHECGWFSANFTGRNGLAKAIARACGLCVEYGGLGRTFQTRTRYAFAVCLSNAFAFCSVDAVVFVCHSRKHVFAIEGGRAAA